jgi:uncharacterized protein YbjT (DUF2867 family)/uncharacterized protein YndB with AHSA1/START domain
MKILITGATGYIGSRLAPLLVEAGYSVRVFVRDRSRLPSRSWVNRAEVIEGDIGDPVQLDRGLNGVDVAYYLVHSMATGPGFHDQDQTIARMFAETAKRLGVGRIIYLGALGDLLSGLTEHLMSRQETGRILGSMNLDVLEYRAGPVVGSGSLPFEMIRYLTERVPVMVCPRWVFTKVQPIGLQDVLSYLVAGIGVEVTGHQVVEIGGSEVVSYGEMMTTYAKVRGLRRVMIRVPVLTPRLSSLWVHVITPLRGSFARPIVEGLRNEVVVKQHTAQTMFPGISPSDYASSVGAALADLSPLQMGESEVRSNSQDGISTAQDNRLGMISERRTLRVAANPAAVFAAFTRLGGANGWFFDWGWRFRCALDRLVGGPGLRKGRPAGALAPNDIVDFWHVEAIEPGISLLLGADMKLPGRAWLEFRATPNDQGGTTLSQISYFAPKGLTGMLYWYALLPIHKFVFTGLIRRVSRMSHNPSN